MKKKANVAIVGGGASSVAAAFTLTNAGHSVTIFEELGNLGGHCFGVTILDKTGQPWKLDAGVTDFNENSYLCFKQFIDYFSLPFHPINSSLSIMDLQNNLVFKMTERDIFLTDNCAVSYEKYKKEINRFTTESFQFLDENPYSEILLGDYLEAHGYSKIFIDEYICPRAAGCFQMPNINPRDYRLIPLLQFWKIHGMIGPPGKRMALENGMFSYLDVFQDWFLQKNRSNKIFLNHRVIGISRKNQRVRIRLCNADGENLALHFDHVIITINAYHILSLFEDAKEFEKNLFPNFPWQRSSFVVHSDPSIMPKNNDDWSSYNLLYTPRFSEILKPTITFYINKIKNLPSQIPDVFLTLNPFKQIDPHTIHKQKFYIHPSTSYSSEISRRHLTEIQGLNNTWFCGSYLQPPYVHESAFLSGIEVANQLVQSLEKSEAKSTAIPFSTRNFIDFLKNLPLFSGIDPSVFIDISLVSSVQYYKEDVYIFKQFDRPDGMYIIFSGSVSIEITKPDKTNYRITELGSGDIFGELGLLANIQRTANAKAKSECQLFFIQKNVLDSIFNNYNPSAFIFTQKIIESVVKRIKKMCDQLQCNSFTTHQVLQETPYFHLAKKQKKQVESLELFAYLEKEKAIQYQSKLHYFNIPKNALISAPIVTDYLLYIVNGEVQLNLEADNQMVASLTIKSDEIINPTMVADVYLNCFNIVAKKNTFIMAFSPKYLNYFQYREVVIPIYSKIKFKLSAILTQVNALCTRQKSSRKRNSTRKGDECNG